MRSRKLNFKKDCNIYKAHKAVNIKHLNDQIKFQSNIIVDTSLTTLSTKIIKLR